jgi:hypothetical protein
MTGTPEHVTPPPPERTVAVPVTDVRLAFIAAGLAEQALLTIGAPTTARVYASLAERLHAALARPGT